MEGQKKSILGPLWFKSFVLLATLVGYALLLEYLGFLICTFLFMFILLKSMEAYGWKLILGISLSTAIASYLIFYLLLKTQLPMGILTKYLVF